MPISIYPPTLQSTQPAFLATTPDYEIKYTLQKVTSAETIKHIQIRVVEQRSNSSIVNTSKYPDNIIYKNVDLTKESSPYGIKILTADLRKSWSPGVCYKIQLRFGTVSGNDPILNDGKFPDDLKQFASWKKAMINAQLFSEWSTVMIIKAIAQPEVYIENAGTLKMDVTSSIKTEASLTPLFVGDYIDNASEEPLEKYKFDLYDEAGEDLIESSNWIQAVHGKNYSYRFKTMLTNNESYKVYFSIITRNGYEGRTSYDFQAVKVYLEALTDASMRVDDSSAYCKENGCLRVYLTADSPLTGCYVLTRTSEETNYQVYEELKYFNYFDTVLDDELIYSDFIIESGIKYKYAFQYQNSQGLRSAPLQENGANPPARSVDFEYSYIYRDGVQLRLKYNQKLSSFKHTTLASKQDTLGDQFPHLAKNGYAYYAEFPISGLISFQMDEDQTFFILKDDGYYYNEELVIPADKFSMFTGTRGDAKAMAYLPIDTTITDDNIFIERKFREKVEQFLNDFTYKLYKSPTEGNIVIGLMNVSMTPNASLGRMIFEFSATAYEVLENTLENIDQVGIINIGTFNEEISKEKQLSFGQIEGIYSGCPEGNDIYSLIKEQEEIAVGGGRYKLSLIKINSFWIERYPQIDFDGKIYELEAKRIEQEIAGEDTEETESELARWKALKKAASSAQSSAVRLSINGTEIVVAPNRFYSVREGVNSLELISAKYPIIINYVCSLTREKNDEVGEVESVDTSRIWGQISGIFSGTDKILKNYKYYYEPNELPYRIYSDFTGEEDKLGRILVDKTNYNVYKTVNLYNIIEEETRKQVEFIYNIQGGFEQDEEGKWTNGIIYYAFSDIISFDIEADPQTVLYIGQKKDGSDKHPVMLGPTGRYTLNPMDGMIRYIALQNPQFAVINYKCLTTQTIMKYSKERG